jgi:predicted RNA-binding protein with PIN domain
VTRPVSRRNPLEGVTQLLVDGNNLLHAASHGRDRQPPTALIGRLRGAIPAETMVVLVFDGPPERGIRGERIAGGVTVHYGGRHTADTILVTLVEEVAMTSSSATATDTLLVVTDDRDLRLALRRRGARTAGTAWLIGRLDRPRLSSPSIANARPPKPPRIDQPRPGEETIEETVPRWEPGRGATTKRGNGRRRPRGAGAGRGTQPQG